MVWLAFSFIPFQAPSWHSDSSRRLENLVPLQRCHCQCQWSPPQPSWSIQLLIELENQKEVYFKNNVALGQFQSQHTDVNIDCPQPKTKTPNSPYSSSNQVSLWSTHNNYKQNLPEMHNIPSWLQLVTDYFVKHCLVLAGRSSSNSDHLVLRSDLQFCPTSPPKTTFASWKQLLGAYARNCLSYFCYIKVNSPEFTLSPSCPSIKCCHFGIDQEMAGHAARETTLNIMTIRIKSSFLPVAVSIQS